MSSQVREVAVREIVTRARSRGFRMITGLMVLLAVAAPVVLALLPEPSSELREATIALHAEADPALDRIIESLAENRLDVRVIDLDDTPLDIVEQRLADGEYQVVLEPGPTLVWAEEDDPVVANLMAAALQQLDVETKAERLGLDDDELASLFAPLELGSRSLDGDDASDELRSVVAFIGLFTAFVLPQVFGQLTMLSVVEEKSSRIIEVLLSHLRPQTLLIGKIVGLCVLAFVQLALILVGLVASLLVTDVVDVPRSVWQFVPMFALSVLGGLAIYTTLFALLGSLISRQEDAAQVMMPVFAPLMVGYIVGQTAVFGSADSLVVRLLTWFPLTSPMLLPVRVAREAIGPIELAVSIGLLMLGVWSLVKLASRIYEFTLLRTGSRVGWREVIRLSRGSIA